MFGVEILRLIYEVSDIVHFGVYEIIGIFNWIWGDFESAQ